jgi:hypothetical protein
MVATRTNDPGIAHTAQIARVGDKHHRHHADSMGRWRIIAVDEEPADWRAFYFCNASSCTNCRLKKLAGAATKMETISTDMKMI